MRGIKDGKLFFFYLFNYFWREFLIGIIYTHNRRGGFQGINGIQTQKRMFAFEWGKNIADGTKSAPVFEILMN